MNTIIKVPAAIIVGCLALSVAACGESSGGSDIMTQAKERAAELSPENTARRITADYRKRGVPGKVTCEDFKVGTQFCEVTEHGVRIVRLKVTIGDGNALDIEPIVN